MTGLGRTLMIMVSIVALGSAAHGQNRFKIKFGLRNLKPMKGVSLKVNAPSKALKSVLASGPRHIVNDPQGNLIQEGAKVEITKRY